MTAADTLIINAEPLLTMATGETKPLSGRDMGQVGEVANGALAIGGSEVLEAGPTDAITAKYSSSRHVIDAGGRLVMPGFVDSHTHLVFAGSREGEMGLRLGKASYLDILKSGGGIHNTASATRSADEETLIALGMERLDRAAVHGTTTAEIKSGYGLDDAGEKKTLRAIHALGSGHAVDVVSTYLGAHAVPKGENRGAFMDRLESTLAEFLPLAEFFDAFCDEGAFTLDETVRLLGAAGDTGFKLKVHAGQFADLGAAGVAAGLGAVSCDHLEHVSDDQLAVMRSCGTVAVLLPGVPFFLKSAPYPDGRRLIDAGVPVALATDFNPGSCPCVSMQMMVALAVFNCGMTAREALVAATVNSAFALGRGDAVGSLAPGKQADVVILDVSAPEQIPYFFGGNLVRCVIKRGELIYEAPRIPRRNHGL